MNEIKVIAVPVDFSENAQKIAEGAAYIAGTFNAEVHFIYVVQNFEDYSGFIVPPVDLPNIEQDIFRSAEERMERFMQENGPLCADKGVKKCVSEVLIGDVGEEILAYSDKIGADLIIMGTHGYKGLERILFGSVADKVVKTSSCPVLTINPYRRAEKQRSA